jgi:hypothetical protein
VNVAETPTAQPQLPSAPPLTVRPATSSTDSILQWGFVVITIALGLWILFKVITQDQFLLIAAVVIGFFVITKLTQAWFEGQEQARKVIYKPWNPQIEIPNICMAYHEMNKGYRIIRILRWAPEPEFGRLSADYPHSIHMWVREMDNRGIIYTSTLVVGLLHRNFIKYEFMHIHRETGSHSWTNARKGQEPILSPYMTGNTRVVTIPTQNPVGEAPKDEETPKDDQEEES